MGFTAPSSDLSGGGFKAPSSDLGAPTSEVPSLFSHVLNPPPDVKFEDPTFNSPIFKAMGVVGNAANNGIQKGTNYLAEKAGQYLPLPAAYAADAAMTVPATLAQAILPKNPEEAGMSLISGMKPALNPESAIAPQVTPKVPAKVTQPNTLEKAAGGLLSATTRIPERFTSAVIADPSILDKNTPSVASVGKEFDAYFKAKGVNINSESLRELTGNDFIPNDNQYTKLNETMVRPTLDLIRDGKMPSEDQLIFAERAANAMKRSTGAQQNKYIMSYANGAQRTLLDHLEKSGFSDLPELKAQYFKALAKDAFQDFLPRNKTGGPNALSTLLMLKQAGGALGDLASGNVSGAISKGVQTAAFSPLLAGQAIRGVSAGLSPSVDNTIARAGLTLGANNQDEEKASPTNSWFQAGNTINPNKSGSYKAQLNSLGLPNSHVSGGGKISLQQFADKFSGGDEDKAIELLRGMK